MISEVLAGDMDDDGLLLGKVLAALSILLEGLSFRKMENFITAFDVLSEILLMLREATLFGRIKPFVFRQDNFLFSVSKPETGSTEYFFGVWTGTLPPLLTIVKQGRHQVMPMKI